MALGVTSSLSGMGMQMPHYLIYMYLDIDKNAMRL